MNTLDQISTAELNIKMHSGNLQVIDTRPVDAYNGWKLKNERRGGHIPGARSLPSKWANYIDWIEIVKSKGLDPNKETVLYGYSSKEIFKVARQFDSAGYRKLRVYLNFVQDWLGNTRYPVDFLPKYDKLVPASWVNELVQGHEPEGMDNQDVVICHAHYRNPDAYLTGHIPGAIELDTLALESPDTWNRRSPAELEKALLAHGITADTTVVLYGKFLFPDTKDEFPGSAAGHIGAIRCAFIMMYAGVKDVRVMNGGFQSWQDEGYEISKKKEAKKSKKRFGVKIPANPQLAVDINEAKELLASDQGDLVSVRSWSEYVGEVSGYNYIQKKGRIPGALFGNCGTDAYHMENYRNLDHTTREANEIEAIWDEAGVEKGKRLAFYCGTGWRGSEAFFNAWLMDWPSVAVFDGGWFEWSKDSKNPFETGVPQVKLTRKMQTQRVR